MKFDGRVSKRARKSPSPKNEIDSSNENDIPSTTHDFKQGRRTSKTMYPDVE